MKSIFLSFACLCFGSLAFAQTDQQHILRLVKVFPDDKAVPGLIMQVFVDGLGNIPDSALNENSATLFVVQNGQRYKARTRYIVQGGIPTEDKSAMKWFPVVVFTVPRGLNPGSAELVISYAGRDSLGFNITILDRPPKPHTAITISRIGSAALSPENSPGQLSPATKVKNIPEVRFERGKEVPLPVSTLVDNKEVSDAAILVTFQQGTSILSAEGRVTYREATRSEKVWTPAHDDATLTIPAGLALGPVDVTIHLRINGQLSDPATLKATIIDPLESAFGAAPQITLVTPKKVGPGQAVHVSVDSARSLGVDPDKARIVIEQNGIRYDIKPEINTAIGATTRGSDLPVFLIGRVRRDLQGIVTVKVFNPELGQVDGLSNGVPLEILADPMPPEIIEVREATPQDLAPLEQLREAARARGEEFKLYDLKARYIAVRANGLDYDAKYLRVQFEQEGRVFQLALEKLDFLPAPEPFSLVVRVPKEVRSGPLVISVENKYGKDSSSPVKKEFVLK